MHCKCVSIDNYTYYIGLINQAVTDTNQVISKTCFSKFFIIKTSTEWILSTQVMTHRLMKDNDSILDWKEAK